RRRPAVAVRPLGEAPPADSSVALRGALAPRAGPFGEVPPFDLRRAHALYRTLLLPVRAGWGDAHSLVVVPHGPLAQLPFAVLPTVPVALATESGALFSNYRAVPWLIRSHAVTVLPSVTALATLRALLPGDPTRRPFVGFGDPYFSEAQAQVAEAEAAGTGPAGRADGTAADRQRVEARFRDVVVSPGPTVHRSQLGRLPRLPDTREEILAMAHALGARVETDVFLGRAANEQRVASMDLSNVRVIAFATHGLVPGDLDGLRQPALALTAPEV